MGRWGAILGVYILLSLAAVGFALWLDISPLTHPEPWLTLNPLGAHAYSSLIGLTLGLVVGIGSSRLSRSVHWARTLRDELVPLSRGLDGHLVPWVALSSSVGEELLFRSVLGSFVGLVPQALVFGLVHQLPGRARFTWVAWATIMGLMLGALFQATGSLLGPVLAHATINGIGLSSLRRHDMTQTPRPLGGVLGQRT